MLTKKQFLEETELQQSVKGNFYADTETARIVIFPDKHSPDRWQFMLIVGEDRLYYGTRYSSMRKALAAGFDAACELE